LIAVFEVTFDPRTGTFDIAPWEAVECTFVNDASSFLKVIKDSGMSGGTFPFELTLGPDAENFDITTPFNGGMAMTLVKPIQSETYNLEEIVPNDWTLTNALCERFTVPNGEDGTDRNTWVPQGVNPPVTFDPRIGTFDIAPWEAIECKYDNELPKGFLKIIKMLTSPTPVDSPTLPFNFNFMDGTVMIRNEQIRINHGEDMEMSGFIDVIAGNNFKIIEFGLPLGYTLIDVSCVIVNERDQWGVPSNTTPTGTLLFDNDLKLIGIENVEVEVNKDTECTFKNSNQSFLKVIKESTPRGDTFPFELTLGPDADNFNIITPPQGGMQMTISMGKK